MPKVSKSSYIHHDHESSWSTFILGIVSFFFLVLASFFLISDYYNTIEFSEKLTLHRLKGIVNSLASQIDGDLHQKVAEKYHTKDAIDQNKQDEDYWILHRQLLDAQLAHQLQTPVYTFVNEVSKNKNEVNFIITSNSKPYYRHAYTSNISDHQLKVVDKGAVEMSLYSDEFGHWLSAIAPVKNSQGETVAYVQADEKFGHFISKVRWNTAQNALFSGVGFCLILLLLLPYLRKLLKREEKQKALLEQSLGETKALSDKLEENEAQLKKYMHQLSESNRDLTDFAKIASHDLKSPLRNIHSFAQLIKRRNKTKLDENSIELLDFILNSALKGKEMVDGLLSYSTIDKDKTEPIIIPTQQLVEDACRNLQSIIEDKNVQIKKEGQFPSLKIKPSLITQVFQNLINNGIKYNEATQPEILIGFTTDNKQGPCFYVKDNGIGIAKEYQDKVFQMFSRLHSSETYEGSGIGLAFCSRVVHTYGGRIWLESEMNKGSIFYFTLPDAMKETQQVFDAPASTTANSTITSPKTPS